MQTVLSAVSIALQWEKTLQRIIVLLEKKNPTAAELAELETLETASVHLKTDYHAARRLLS